MSFIKSLSNLISPLLIFTLSTPSHSTLCPPDGPPHPRPITLSTSPIFAKTASSLTSTLDSAISGNLPIPWSLPNVSFSIAIVSLDTPDPQSPLWEYHHLATNNVNGTKKIDRDSQYLIGSISKAFTDLLLLKSGLDMHDPVTNYIPELKGHSVIQWEDVTLGALGNHLSGMPGSCKLVLPAHSPSHIIKSALITCTDGFPEISFLFPFFEDLGFPHLPDSSFPNCGVIGLNVACTRKRTFPLSRMIPSAHPNSSLELLANLKSSHPIAAPNLRPSYSSLAFTLLSYALTSSSGKAYSQLLHEQILVPLNMTNTGVSPGNDTRAVIPSMENSWGSDYGDNAPFVSLPLFLQAQRTS
jgi:CubicO group peptidase (beta-lactamase class C family)